MKDIATLQVLKNELRFVQKGGYRQPLLWRPPLVFEDSPICLKHSCAACPETNCVLLNFVPEERRHDTVPCRYIPLNDLGETIDSLYRTGTNEEIEDTLQNWLLKTIGQLEEQCERPWLEKAA